MVRATRFAGFTIICLLNVTMLWSQVTTASLSGTVLDESKAVVPGALVMVTETNTGFSAKIQASDSGFYTFPALAPGLYNLQVEKPGFRTSVQQGLVLQVDKAASIDVVLKLGTSSETVTVTGQGTQIDVRTPTLSYEITDQSIQELPLNGRDVLQLMSLSPDISYGTNNYISQSATRPEATVGFVSASGGQGNTTVFYLDGGQNGDAYTSVANVYPNPDAIQEFSFESNNFSAKYTGSGGGVMNVVTRGGTNAFHGTLYDFLRNGPLFDAKSYFGHSNDNLKWNQFGGSVGGPILKGKTLFFFSYQALRESVASSGHFTGSATQAELNGDWSKINKQLVNPNTGLPYAGNQVPTTSYDPIALKLLALVPVASPTTGLSEYSQPFAENDNQFVARVDQSFSDNLRVYASYVYDGLTEPSREDKTNILSASPNQYWRSQHATLNGTWVPRPHLLANFTATFNRAANLYSGPPDFPGWTQLGSNVPNLTTGGSKSSLYLYIGGYIYLAWDAKYRIPRQQFDYSTNWSYVAGKNTVDYGAEIERDAATVDSDYHGNGNFNFLGALSGNNLLDFMLGKPSEFDEIEPFYESLRKTAPALYLNDTWKATHRLTLALGMRWDPWIPWTDIIAHQSAIFSPTAFAAGTHSTLYPSLPPGYLVAGDPGVPIGGYLSRYAIVDPRIGFAYDVFGNGTTSVRGGFGIYHEQLEAIANNRQLNSPPFNVQVEVTFPPSTENPYQNTVDPFPVSRPTPANYVFPTPFTAVPYYPGAVEPTIQQWNLIVEHQLPGKTLLRVAYEGARSYHMPGAIEGNAGVFNSQLSFTQNEQTIQQRRPMGQYFTSLSLMKTIGIANYNALVVSVEKRASHGLTALGGYRRSRCLDELSQLSYGSDDYISTDPSFNYGPCNYNITSQGTLSYVYQLATFNSLGVVGRYLLSGWQNSGILTLRSGLPYSITSGLDNSTSGIGSDLADIVGYPNLPGNRSTSQKLGEWFNTQAFAPNALGTFGNSGRNPLAGPGFWNLDFSMVKSFPISKVESSRLDFRGDFFNLFNHTNFGNPSSSMSNPSSFGRISSAQSPRIIQLALKYHF